MVFLLCYFLKQLDKCTIVQKLVGPQWCTICSQWNATSLWKHRSTQLDEYIVDKKKSLFDNIIYSYINCTSGVMVSMLSLSVINNGLKPQSGQTKDYKRVFCCFSSKNTALTGKTKDWLARNHDKVIEGSMEPLVFKESTLDCICN